MGWPSIAFVVVSALVLVASDASAHLAGSPPITQTGSFELFRKGTNNSSAPSFFHAYITSLGIPPGPGDTLRFSWSANQGLGPAIFFEIHTHPTANASQFLRQYSTMAVRADDSWAVPGPGDYMVFWDNPNAVDVNVTYTFQLIAPTDLAPLLAFPAVLAGVAAAILIDRRRRRSKP